MSLKCGIFLLVLVGGIGYCAGDGCFDKNPYCNDWKNNNQCHANPYSVLRTCPKSCDVRCDPCEDHRSDCNTQFMKDECHKNPYATIMLCPKSCGACW